MMRSFTSELCLNKDHSSRVRGMPRCSFICMDGRCKYTPSAFDSMSICFCYNFLNSIISFQYIQEMDWDIHELLDR
jgi:hypothetical protein